MGKWQVVGEPVPLESLNKWEPVGDPVPLEQLQQPQASTPTLDAFQTPESEMALMDAGLPFMPSNVFRDVAASGEPFMRSLIQSLPVAGSMAGGAAGTLSGAGVMSPILGVAGAGLGAGIGESTRKLLSQWLYDEKPPESVPQAMQQAGDAAFEGAKGEIYGGAATAMLGKALGPFRQSFEKAIQSGGDAATGKALVDSGVPIKTSSYQPTRFAQALDWISDKLYPGKFFSNKARDEVTEAITKMRNDFISKDAGMIAADTSPLKLSEAKKKAFTGFLDEAGGADAIIDIPNVRQVIKDSINSKTAATDPLWSKVGKSKSSGFLTEFFHSSGVGITAKDLNNFRSKIWSNYGKLTPDQKALRGELLEAFKADVVDYETRIGAKVMDKLDAAMLSVKDQRELGKSRYIEALLDSATKLNEETRQLEFQPALFEQTFRKNKFKLQQMLDPEQFTAVQAFVDKTKLAIPTMAGKRGDSTGQLVGMGASVLWQPGLAVPLGFQAIVSRSLANPRGWVRKWLTEGIKPPALPLTKEAVKIGTMEME